MGMYDSIYIDIQCPFCGKESKLECQTKELDSNLDIFKPGDSIGTDQYNYLVCITDCHSNECMEYEEKAIGYKSGFGRMFDVKVKLKDSVITGEYEILRLHESVPLKNIS